MTRFFNTFQRYFARQDKTPDKTLGQLPLGVYSFQEMYGEASSNIVKMVEEFNTSDDFGKLRCFASPKELEDLWEIRDRHPIVFISCCGQDRITQLLRNNNFMADVPFEADDIIFLPLGSDKNDAIMDIRKKYMDRGIIDKDDSVLFFDNCVGTVFKTVNLPITGMVVDHYRDGHVRYDDLNYWQTLHSFTEILREIKRSE